MVYVSKLLWLNN